MKWLTLVTFMSLFMFAFVAACSPTTAHVSPTYTPVPQYEFKSFSASPVTRLSTSSPTPTSPPPTSSPKPSKKPRPTASPRVVTTGGSRRVFTGEASWGYGFKGNVVTRYPRGTVIRVCGRLGCTGKVRSWGYGPAKRTGRIADLDVAVFENVCGPRGMGVCQIRLEVWK